VPGIIVGVDGSGHSRHALEWAIKEAAVRRSPLTVLTVQQPASAYWGVGAAVPVPCPYDQDLGELALKMAQEETSSAIENIGPEGRPSSVTVRAVVAMPAEALIKAAADAELLVVGSRGVGGFRRLLLGSVSTQVTQHAQCPVVVIPSTDE